MLKLGKNKWIKPYLCIRVKRVWVWMINISYSPACLLTPELKPAVETTECWRIILPLIT